MGEYRRTPPRKVTRLTDYTGFGEPVLAPADGRVVEVIDGYHDNPPGTTATMPTIW